MGIIDECLKKIMIGERSGMVQDIAAQFTHNILDANQVCLHTTLEIPLDFCRKQVSDLASHPGPLNMLYQEE
jgi:hypothetical protein